MQTKLKIVPGLSWGVDPGVPVIATPSTHCGMIFLFACLFFKSPIYNICNSDIQDTSESKQSAWH